MHSRLKKAVVFGLSACLMLGSLSGCSKKEKAFDPEASAVTVNGEEISAGLVKFATHYTQALTEDLYKTYMGVSDPMSQDLYGNGSTMGDMIKSQTVSGLENMVLAEQKMEEYGVSLTDEEKDSITEAATKFLDENGEEVLDKMGATQETVERYLTLRLIQNKMEPEMSSDVDTEVSDEEAAQRKVQYAMFRAETEAESESETETGSEGETAAETETGSEAATEAATEISEETTLAQTEAATEVTAAESITEAATEKATEAETAELTGETDTKTQSAAETESETASEAVTEAATDAAKAESVTEAEGTEAATESTTEAVSGDAQETETETETETEDPAMVEAKAKARAKAEELIAKVKAGEDFETAAGEVDPDAACSTMTFGSDSTSVVEGLITATEGLDDGTLVETPIETDSGYYVAQVISKLDREATDTKKEEIVDQRKSDRISELYTQWKDDGEVTEHEDVLAQIVFDFSLSQETEASTEASTEAATQSGETELNSESGKSEAVTEAVTEAGQTEAVTEAATKAGETEAVTEAATETDTEVATEAAKSVQTEAAAQETETEAVTEAQTK